MNNKTEISQGNGASKFRIFFRYDLAVFLACIAFFLIFPKFDLYVSQHFYDSPSGRFFWKNHFITDFIYELTHVIAAAMLITLPVMIVLGFLIKIRFLKHNRRALVFLLTALLVGPGLIVNSLLKENWERPRPRQVMEFGGDKNFVAPFAPTFECDKCRSFVSGHASVGFYFFALALLLRNRKWFLLPITLGIVIGATRVVQGGHFFSDVLFSGWVVWFSSLILYQLFFKPPFNKRIVD